MIMGGKDDRSMIFNDLCVCQCVCVSVHTRVCVHVLVCVTVQMVEGIRYRSQVRMVAMET